MDSFSLVTAVRTFSLVLQDAEGEEESIPLPLAKLLGAVSAKTVVQADEDDRNDQDNSADRFYLVARAQETSPTGLGEQKWQGGE